MKTSWSARGMAFVMAGFAAAAVTVSAHHSFAMFDMDKDVEYSGVVKEWRWQNPHVHLVIEVKAGKDVNPETVGVWDVEGGSINIMARQGWTRRSYQAGDPIKLVGHPMKDVGSPGTELEFAL